MFIKKAAATKNLNCRKHLTNIKRFTSFSLCCVLFDFVKLKCVQNITKFCDIYTWMDRWMYVLRKTKKKLLRKERKMKKISETPKALI